jgi:uncharacterized membrane protein (TIGR02234 family)
VTDPTHEQPPDPHPQPDPAEAAPEVDPVVDPDVDVDAAPDAAPDAGRGRSIVSAIVVIVIGGLAVAGSSVAEWVVEEITVTIAGMELPDYITTTGLELVGAMLPIGLAGAAAGVAVAAVRGPARRVAAGIVALLGVASLVAIGIALLRARDVVGDLTPAPTGAVIGGLALLLGAWMAATHPQAGRALGARYDIDPRTDDAEVETDEWTLAAGEDGPTGDGPTGDGPGRP